MGHYDHTEAKNALELQHRITKYMKTIPHQTHPKRLIIGAFADDPSCYEVFAAREGPAEPHLYHKTPPTIQRVSNQS